MKNENWSEVERGWEWENDRYNEDVYIEEDSIRSGETWYRAWNEDPQTGFRMLIDSGENVTEVREEARIWMKDNPHGLASHSTEIGTDVGNWEWVERQYEGFTTEAVWINPATEETVSVDRDSKMHGGADWTVNGDGYEKYSDREEAIKRAKAMMLENPAGFGGSPTMGDHFNATTGT